MRIPLVLIRSTACRLSMPLLFLCLAPLIGCGEIQWTAASSAAGPAPITTRVSPVDGKAMVNIPAGEFQMGTSEEQKAKLGNDLGVNDRSLNTESPYFRLALAEFYIDQTPVTNAEYKKFLDAHPAHAVPFVDETVVHSYNWDKSTRTFPPNRDAYPVVLVSWSDAQAYCHWAGKRLPSEAEWEKAARGTDGRLWPWGNEWDTSKANSVEEKSGDASPVGQYPGGASPYGALDMVGNVWQWTSSLDRPYPYVANDGREDPKAAGLRITRGGSWGFGPAVDRTSLRNHFDPADVSLSIGFRCVQ